MNVVKKVRFQTIILIEFLAIVQCMKNYKMDKEENKEMYKELHICDFCILLINHIELLFIEKEFDEQKDLLEMKFYYWLIKAYSDGILKDCDCFYSKELRTKQKIIKEIIAKEGIALDENNKKCDICKILPCEFFALLNSACILKDAKEIDSMVEELRYHLNLAYIYEKYIGKCTECDAFVEYKACLQFVYDFIESRNQKKLQQDVYYWKMARNNAEIWSSADALDMDENILWTDVDLKDHTKIYFDFNVYQRYEEVSNVHEFFETLTQLEDVAIIYSVTHLEEIMRMGIDKYKTKRIESIQKLTGGKIAVVGADKKIVICIQDIQKRFQHVKKYWKMNAIAEERECIQTEAREYLGLHEFDEKQEKAIGSSSLGDIIANINENGKKKNEQLPDKDYLNKVLGCVGIGDRSICEYMDALKDEKKEFDEVRMTIVSIAKLLNILGLHGDKIKKKEALGAVYPIYYKDSFRTIRSGYYDNDHLAVATQCTYFVTTDDTLYKKAKEIYDFFGSKDRTNIVERFYEVTILK